MRSSRAANAILEPARKRQQQQQQHPVLHAGIVLGKEIAAVEAGRVGGRGCGKGRQMQSTNNEMNCQVQTCR